MEGRDGNDPTLSDALYAFKCLWNLKYAQDENGRKFSNYLQMLRDWRNEEAHNAPNSTEEEINAAIQIIVAMYLYVTAYSIDNLKKNEHNIAEKKKELESGTPKINTYQQLPVRESLPAAESVVIQESPEDKHFRIFKKSLSQFLGYRFLQSSFNKQRHWIAIYRVAADRGFIKDGDFTSFEQMINRIQLSGLPTLHINQLEKSIQGIYTLPLNKWTDNRLQGKELRVFEDIKRCAEAFARIVDNLK